MGSSGHVSQIVRDLGDELSWSPGSSMDRDSSEVRAPAGFSHDHQVSSKSFSSARSLRQDQSGRSALARRPVHMTGWRAGCLVATTTAAMMLNILSMQSVTAAIKIMGDDLGMRPESFQWLTSSYALTLGSLPLFLGRLGDLFGHKRLLVSGMSWFMLSSLAVALSKSDLQVIVFRALQGVGAAASIPACVALLSLRLAPRSRLRNFGFALFSCGAPIGACIGFTLGGVTAQTSPSGWRNVFYLSTGAAGAIAIASCLIVPRDPPCDAWKAFSSLDWLGAILSCTGLVLVTFALASSETSPKGWQTWYIPTALGAGFVLVVVFYLWQRYLERSASAAISAPNSNSKSSVLPLMRPSLWKRGRFALVIVIALLAWSSFNSFMFFGSLYYQGYRRLTPVQTVVRFLPTSLVGLIITNVIGLLANVLPTQVMFCIGSVGTAVAPLLLGVMPSVPKTYWSFEFPAMTLAPFGADFIYTAGVMYVASVAHEDEQGMAAGIFNMADQVGTAIGLAITTILQQSIQGHSAGAHKPEAVLKGLRAAFYLTAGCGAAAAMLSIVGLYGIGKVGTRSLPDGKEPNDEESAVGTSRSDGTLPTSPSATVCDLGKVESEHIEYKVDLAEPLIVELEQLPRIARQQS